MMSTNSAIYIVDDNETTRQALKRLLESAGLTAETYPSAREFLEGYQATRPGCLLLDIRMPGMNGLELQEKLARTHVRIPVIIVSAHGEVENVVRAMKNGAVDFLKKPYRAKALLERIRQALELDARLRHEEAERAEAAACLAQLTPREREIMLLLTTGQAAKQVAQQLGLSRSTVDIHRSHIMAKLNATSILDLLRIARLCEMEAQGPRAAHAASASLARPNDQGPVERPAAGTTGSGGDEAGQAMKCAGPSAMPNVATVTATPRSG